MVNCDHCLRNVSGTRIDEGQLCCEYCGKVLEECFLSNEPTFQKGAAGQSKFSGNLIRAVNEMADSRQRTTDRATENIRNLCRNLGMDDYSVADAAVKFYIIGLEKNFTRGRRSELVQAACLYLAFRDNDKPYLLIDFSNAIRTNVYALGSVFLQLLKVLRLEEHPIARKLVDPSLFIFKFTHTLLKQRNVAVSESALNILSDMKRNWMQTGRKPSGLCGAALYMAALANGFPCSKSDVLRVVHVCEATLTKRLIEFENTESSSLTIDELNAMAKEHENRPIKIPNGEPTKYIPEEEEEEEEGEEGDPLTKKKKKKDPLRCEHKGMDPPIPLFALGLCETCYRFFDKLSGGLGGGLDPPAFQRAEKDRMVKSHSEENANKSDDLAMDSNDAYESQIELHTSEPGNIGGEHVATKDGEHDESRIEDDMNEKTHDESESLSDIDDKEVDGYLHNEEETRYKKQIWEFNNREYLEEQAVKEAAAAAERRRLEEELKNCTPEEREARELKGAVAADVAKSRKEKRKQRAEEERRLGPAQSAVEATSRMLKTKRLSSKVNLDRLDKLFDKPAAPENPKKVRFETKEDELEPVNEFPADEDMYAEYDDTMYPENNYETYDYEEAGGFYEY